jgi:ABC-type Na+ transport system ATPase subunit NatA
MENMTVVETIGLTKRYGSGVLAVDSVGISVRCGEVYGADIAAEHGERAKLIVSP